MNEVHQGVAHRRRNIPYNIFGKGDAEGGPVLKKRDSILIF